MRDFIMKQRCLACETEVGNYRQKVDGQYSSVINQLLQEIVLIFKKSFFFSDKDV